MITPSPEQAIRILRLVEEVLDELERDHHEAARRRLLKELARPPRETDLPEHHRQKLASALGALADSKDPRHACRMLREVEQAYRGPIH